MYQALYRKWRPRTFDQVVGQEHITSTLKRQVETGRLSHAYLFSGTRGTGKTTCARILARAVNCEHPENGNPCNQCASCRGIEDGSVMDVVELDAASHNGVDDVRALRDEAIYSPASVSKRVYIIDEVHALASSSMAFNALLKILEEPPEHVIFILCTTAPHRIPATIVSRCQRHSFTRIEPERIADRLLYVAGQEQMDLEPDAAALLARMADGGMRDALSLLDQCAANEHIDTAAVLSAMGLAGSRRTAELLDAIAAGNVEKALSTFDRLWRDGKEPAGILDELSNLLRDTLLLQVAPRGGESLVSGIFDTSTLGRFAAKLTGAQLMDAMNAIRAADLAGSNPRRAAEMCLVALCVPESGDSLTGLKNRVERLEAALKNGVSVPVPAAVPPAPESEPEPVWSPPPPPTDDDVPWFTDDDAPPEAPERYIPSPPPREPEPEPVPPPPQGKVIPIRPDLAQAPEPKPAPAVQADVSQGGAPWELLVQRLNGKLDMGAYAILMANTQVTGIFSGNTMTVHLTTPIAKMMLDTPDNLTLFREELTQIVGQPVQVIFTDEPAPTAPAQPDMSKLDALSKFSNFKFE